MLQGCVFLRLLAALAVAFACVAPAGPALAAAGKGFLGVQGGIAMPTNASAVFAFGLNGLWQRSPRYGIGAFLLMYGARLESSTEAGQVISDYSVSLWGVEANYFFGGGLRGGARLGIMNSSGDYSASDASSEINIAENQDPLFLMPLVAYDYRFGKVSIGGEMGYFLGMGSGAPSGFLFMIAPKFWF
ncbi:MAG: hypothetical protein IT285_03150 [Bdellovibrionales bacterium]|nr:hypothetical protein [Bdellovibrionales bacterium]